MGPKAKSQPAICPEKRRLSDAFLCAVQEITKLQSKNFDAVTSGSGADEGFDRAIEQARQRRDEAKRAYERHLRQHGC